MLVAGLVLVAGIRIMRRAGHILLQGAPEDLTPAIVRDELIDQVNGVQNVENVHVWLLTEDKPIVTLCVVAETDTNVEELSDSVKHYLKEELRVHMATVEITTEPDYGILSVVPDPLQMTGSF